MLDLKEAERQLTSRRLDINKLRLDLRQLEISFNHLLSEFELLTIPKPSTTLISPISSSSSAVDSVYDGTKVIHALAHLFQSLVTLSSDLAITGKVGFYGAAPVVQQALAAYTGNLQNAAYTGIDNLQVGTPYAKLTDLNTLRLAYENLRVAVEDIRARLQLTTLVT